MNAHARKLLDETDWSAINHAYGPAIDVPEMLEQLCSPDKETREDAAWCLNGTIVHQGTVYEASAPAAKVLLELLDEREHVDCPTVMFLLYDIANGTGYYQEYDDFAKTMWSRPEFDQMLAKERGWVDAAHAAVREGLPKFRMMLDDCDPATRDGASLLVSAFPEDVEKNLPAIISAFDREQEILPRVGLTFALSVVGKDDPEAKRRLLKLFDGEGLEQIIAAMYYAKSSDDSLALLARGVLQRGDPPRETLPPSLWLEERPLDARCYDVLRESRHRNASS